MGRKSDIVSMVGIVAVIVLIASIPHGEERAARERGLEEDSATKDCVLTGFSLHGKSIHNPNGLDMKPEYGERSYTCEDGATLSFKTGSRRTYE